MMGTQHHFVVYGVENDDGTIEWVIDHDTTDAHFSDGAIFDMDADVWVNNYNDDDEVRQMDDRIHADLSNRLKGN